MKLAVSNIAWQPEERLDAYRILADAGFTGLEIAPGLFFHAARDPFVPDAPEARRAVDEMRKAGLALVSMQSLLFGVDGASLFGSPAERAALENGLARAITLAGRFAIPNCVFGSPRQRVVPADMPMQRAWEEAAVIFRRLGDHARDAGTHLSIEANPAQYGGNFCTTTDEALRFIDYVDHPHITSILDLGAVHIAGEFDIVSAKVPAMMQRLNHVHVSEPDLALAPARPTNLAPVLRALRKSGYAKAISIEMRRTPGGLADLESAVHRLAAVVKSLEAHHA